MKIFVLVAAIYANAAAMAQINPTPVYEIAPARMPLLEDGNIVYEIIMSGPWLAQREDAALRGGEPPSAPPAQAKSFWDYATPSSRVVAKEFERLTGGRVLQILSWAGSSIYLIADQRNIKLLFGHEGIARISEVESDRPLPAFSAPIKPTGPGPTKTTGDQWVGSEIRPWYKIATNTQDYLPNYVRISVIDGHVHPSIPSLDLNYGLAWNSGALPSTTDPWDSWPYYHAQHVHGVIGAKSNGLQIMGVNPGQSIYSYGGPGGNWVDVAARIDKAVYDTHHAGVFGAASMSINGGGSDEFESTGVLGNALAQLSARNLVFQSTGNHGETGCLPYHYTYGSPGSPQVDYDGIMIIGGHDRNNQQLQNQWIYSWAHGDWVEMHYPINLGGSNYGSCIDLWAPGDKITSLRFNTNLRQVWSGTSFAAPIAAAIASRYGVGSTRPLEREWVLKHNAFSPTTWDASGYPIKRVRWLSTPASTLTRHPVVGAWSPENNINISTLYNGNLREAGWNANQYTGLS